MLPSGEASIDKAESVDISTKDGKRRLTEYLITGLDFQPTAIWLDEHGTTAAQVANWFSVLPAAYHDALARWFNEKYLPLMDEKGREAWPRVAVMLGFA